MFNDKDFAKTDSIATALNNHINKIKSVTKKRNTTYKIPKWQFGVTAFYGRSKLNEDVSNFT